MQSKTQTTFDEILTTCHRLATEKGSIYARDYASRRYDTLPRGIASSIGRLISSAFPSYSNHFPDDPASRRFASFMTHCVNGSSVRFNRND